MAPGSQENDLENPGPKTEDAGVAALRDKSPHQFHAPSQFPSSTTSQVGTLELIMLVWVFTLLLSNLMDTTFKETVDEFIPSNGWSRVVSHWGITIITALLLYGLVKWLSVREEKQKQAKQAHLSVGTTGHPYTSSLKEGQAQEILDHPDYSPSTLTGLGLSDVMGALHAHLQQRAHLDWLRNHPEVDPNTSRRKKPRKSKKIRSSPPMTPKRTGSEMSPSETLARQTQLRHMRSRLRKGGAPSESEKIYDLGSRVAGILY